MFIIATFYHFFDFADFADWKKPIAEELARLGIKGSLLIASEGINGTLVGSRDGIDSLLTYLQQKVVHGEFAHKESLCDYQPFQRAKVRLKKEVISLGVPPPVREGIKRARYVEPKDWNAIIDDPEIVVLDARNHYEVHLGTFKRAIDPNIRTFKELPAYVKKNMAGAPRPKIATFCTGGIRCEKFSSWLLGQGFSEVYQLKGGILKYLEDMPKSESRWQGECYVFDERVAVGHDLEPSQTASQCPACGHALTEEDRKHPLYKEVERCSHCVTKRR